VIGWELALRVEALPADERMRREPCQQGKDIIGS
jgi:hypothetical protein